MKIFRSYKLCLLLQTSLLSWVCFRCLWLKDEYFLVVSTLNLWAHERLVFFPNWRERTLFPLTGCRQSKRICLFRFLLSNFWRVLLSPRVVATFSISSNSSSLSFRMLLKLSLTTFSILSWENPGYFSVLLLIFWNNLSSFPPLKFTRSVAPFWERAIQVLFLEDYPKTGINVWFSFFLKMVFQTLCNLHILWTY